MVQIDASKETRVDVTLKRPSSSSRPRKVASTPAVVAPAPKVVAPAPKVATPAPKVVAPVEAAGQGTLMVSSKPPCDILIDGKPTGLTTPQRSIPLSVGTHKITFVNEAEKIKKTVSVTISADKPTKLIQDLMQK